MSDHEHETEHTDHFESTDGSTEVTESKKTYTDDLGDGSASGGTEDDDAEGGDTDFASGGDPKGE